MFQIETPGNFLFTTWEGGGSVTPALTVAAKLVARGHRVRVMSDRSNRPEAEASGARFIPWTRAPSRPDRSRATEILHDWDVAEPIDGLGRLVEEIMAGPALAYAQDVMEELRREPADLVVSSEMLPGVSAGCEALGQRLALLAVNVSIFPLPGIPPLGPPLPPPRNAKQQPARRDISAPTIAYFDRQLPQLNAPRAACIVRSPMSGRKSASRHGPNHGAYRGRQTTHARWSLFASRPPFRTMSTCCSALPMRLQCCRCAPSSHSATQSRPAN